MASLARLISSLNFTTAAAYAGGSRPHNPNSTKQRDQIDNTSSEEDKNVNRPSVYAIKLEEPDKVKLFQELFNSKQKNQVNSRTTGVCMLWPNEKNCITAGVCMLWPTNNIFHFGKRDYVSVQGQGKVKLNVIGGSGIFEGVQGKVKLQKICIEAPVELFYLEGIEN